MENIEKKPVEVRLKSGAIEVLTVELYFKCSNYDSKGNKKDSYVEQPEKLKRWAKLLKYQLNKDELVEAKIKSLGKKDTNIKGVERDRHMRILRRCANCKKDFHPVIGSEKPYICPECSGHKIKEAIADEKAAKKAEKEAKKAAKKAEKSGDLK